MREPTPQQRRNQIVIASFHGFREAALTVDSAISAALYAFDESDYTIGHEQAIYNRGWKDALQGIDYEAARNAYIAGRIAVAAKLITGTPMEPHEEAAFVLADVFAALGIGSDK